MPCHTAEHRATGLIGIVLFYLATFQGHHGKVRGLEKMEVLNAPFSGSCRTGAAVERGHYPLRSCFSTPLQWSCLPPRFAFIGN